MARRMRVAAGGEVYHVLNRRVGREQIFDDAGDYLAFEKVLAQAHERFPTRLLSYCITPNHWHLVVWPTKDGELSQYLRWITVAHTQRWRAHRQSAGEGPLYQGRFKSFPVQSDRHFLIVCRYVERNALRAKLVEKAQGWEYCSLHRRRAAKLAPWLATLDEWPVEAPKDWASFVNRAETAAELEALRKSVYRGSPFGEEEWTARMAKRLKLQSSLNPPHRPKSEKADKKDS